MKENLFALITFDSKIKVNYKFVLLILFLFFTSIFISTFFLNIFNVTLGKNINNSNFGIFRNTLVLMIIAPTIEEFIFRSSIIINKKNISLSIASTVFFFFLKDEISILNFNLIKIGLSFFLFVFFYLFLTKFIISEKYISFLSKNRIMYIYITIILFSFAHFNFSLPLYYAIFLLLPHFTVGLLLSFFRIKYSLLASIIIHSFFNLPFLVIQL